MKKTSIIPLLSVIFILSASKSIGQNGKDIYHPPATVDSRPKLPDLVITDVKVSGASISSSGVSKRTVTYTIKNIGTAPAPWSKLQVQGYIHNDDVYDFRTMKKVFLDLLGTANSLSKINPGETTTKSISCDSKIFGNYPFLILKIDPLNKVAEHNEDNNHNVAGL